MSRLNKNTTPKDPSKDLQPLIYQPINEKFSSPDLYFVAFLKARYGLKIIETSIEHGRFKWSLNLNGMDARELFDLYLAGEKVPCISFISELKLLKSQIHGF